MVVWIPPPSSTFPACLLYMKDMLSFCLEGEEGVLGSCACDFLSTSSGCLPARTCMALLWQPPPLPATYLLPSPGWMGLSTSCMLPLTPTARHLPLPAHACLPSLPCPICLPHLAWHASLHLMLACLLKVISHTHLFLYFLAAGISNSNSLQVRAEASNPSSYAFSLIPCMPCVVCCCGLCMHGYMRQWVGGWVVW